MSPSGRRPWPVRAFALASRVAFGRLAPELAGEADSAFEALYDDERKHGARPALVLWMRAMADLLRLRLRGGQRAFEPGAGPSDSNPRGRSDAWWQDVRSSFRSIRRRPTVSVVVVVSIGLGIGANTAAFSVVNAVLLRPWGSDDSRVVRVREDYARPGQPPDVRGFSLANFGRWQRENTVFEGLAAGTGQSFALADNGTVERVAGGVVSANFFDVLGFRPALGRMFSAAEDVPGRDGVVVLGDALWRTRFGADPSIVGRSITLNGRARVVVGVMPRGLRHPYQSDLWVPLAYREDAAVPDEVYAPARLKRGVSVEQANREMDALAARQWQTDPSPRTPTGAQVTLLRPEMIGRLTSVIYALAATALFVLVIAAANVSNLLLAQGLEQGSEAALRVALGASRRRLFRQFLIHSLILALLGAAVGVALTFWSVKPLVALSPLYGAGEFDIEPRLDWMTLIFTVTAALVVGALFGLVPAFRASRADAMTVLRESGRSRTLTPSARRWLNGFVVVELALAFVLLVGSGVMLKGLLDLQRASWGFEREHRLTFDLSFADDRYPDRAARTAFVANVVRRLRDVPAVRAVAATSVAPLYAGTEAAAFNLPSGPAPNGRGFFVAHSRMVTAGYFAAAGIPLIAGRDFDARDAATGEPVVIVSRSLAERYWPGELAVGKRIKRGRFDGPLPWMTIVGIVGAIRENTTADIPAGDAWYLPYEQMSGGSIEQMTMVVHVAGEVTAVVPTLRAAIAAVDDQQPISDVMSMDERFDRFTATERLSTMLTAVLAVLGLVLAAVGIYAVLSFSLNRRVPEFGVRTALGAQPMDVQMLVLREAGVLIASGLVLGAAVLMTFGRWLRADLFQSPAGIDWMVIATAIVIVTLAAIASSVIPAMRASRINPLNALRSS